MEEVDVIRAVFLAFAKRDLQAALVLVTEDVECWAKVGMAHSGREHPYLGHEGIGEYFRDVAATFETLEMHVQSARSVAGGATVFGTVRGKLAGGAEFAVPVTLMVRFREGRVAYIRSVASLDAAAAPAGAKAAPG